MFNREFSQCPVGRLLLRSHGDEELSVRVRTAMCRPVLLTLGLGKTNTSCFTVAVSTEVTSLLCEDLESNRSCRGMKTAY